MKAMIDNEWLGEYSSGGAIYIYACGYLTHKKTKVYLEFGYWLNVEATSDGRDCKHSFGVYANIQWKPWKCINGQDLIEVERKLKSFPDEKSVQENLRSLLKEAKGKLCEMKNIPGDVKRLLQDFSIP